MKKRKWSGRTSGANIPNVSVYLCAKCQSWHDGKKPTQCRACGWMEFQFFHSKAEAKRYGELMLEQSYKFITALECQPRFNLHGVRFKRDGNKIGLEHDSITKIGAYVGDFSYIRDGQRIIEDVKGGADTDLSVWKRKHAEAEHGVKITIVRR